jgi:hypothetical protein
MSGLRQDDPASFRAYDRIIWFVPDGSGPYGPGNAVQEEQYISFVAPDSWRLTCRGCRLGKDAIIISGRGWERLPNEPWQSVDADELRPFFNDFRDRLERIRLQEPPVPPTRRERSGWYTEHTERFTPWTESGTDATERFLAVYPGADLQDTECWQPGRKYCVFRSLVIRGASTKRLYHVWFNAAGARLDMDNSLWVFYSPPALIRPPRIAPTKR